MVPTTQRIAPRSKIPASAAARASTRPPHQHPRRVFLVMLVMYALEARELPFPLTLLMDTFVQPGTIALKAQTFDLRSKKSHALVVLSTPSRELLPPLTVFHVLSIPIRISLDPRSVFLAGILPFPTTRPRPAFARDRIVAFNLPQDLVAASLDMSSTKHCRAVTRTQNPILLLIARL